MFSYINTALVSGIDSLPVTVETDISDGMPMFEMVGFLGAEVKEARDRVRAALRNNGFSLPIKRITVNLSPANLKKNGTGYDLPVALSLLTAMNVIDQEKIAEHCIFGELSLDGKIAAVSGVLSMVLMAREKGMKACVVPWDNVREASLVSDIKIYGFKNLCDVIQFYIEDKYPEDKYIEDKYIEDKYPEAKYPEGKYPKDKYPEDTYPEVKCIADKDIQDNYTENKSNKTIYLSQSKNVSNTNNTSNTVNTSNTGNKNKTNNTTNDYDFANINGQPLLRRACEIAISGMHNMLMIGPPGAGKSMVAKCIPSILPPMTFEEKLELSKIYSVCGKLNDDILIDKRPFRSPHHTITEQGLCGGGMNPKPGEISLAHCGVLFLDELSEFNKTTLETLRQPIEDKKVTISRLNATYTYPSNFVLVAAMNSCNCGYFPDLNRCSCSKATISRYLGKVSQPLMDRIDICVEAKTLSFSEINVGKRKNESSEEIRERVIKAHEIQRIRFADEDFIFNKDIPAGKIPKYCALSEELVDFMNEIYEEKELTVRTYHKVLRVARTIADMAGAKEIEKPHLQEAVMYRCIEKRHWINELT